MFCIKCGTELPDESNFCSKCGNPTINNLINTTEWGKEDKKETKISIDDLKKQISNGESNSVIEFCTKSLELNPHDPEIWGLRGEAFYFISKYDLAIKDCSKALEISKTINLEDKKTSIFFIAEDMHIFSYKTIVMLSKILMKR